MRLHNIILIGLVLLTALIPSSAQTWGVVGISGGGGAAAPVACLTDDFSGVTDTALETYSANYKSIGTTLDVGSIEIYDNAARVESTYNAAGCYYDDGSGAKTGTTYTTATVNWSGSTTLMPRVATRASASNTGYSAALTQPVEKSFTRLYLYKNNGDGEPTSLGYTGSLAYDTSTPHTIYLKAEDSGDNVIISAWVDTTTGDPIKTYTDTSEVISSGYSGFFFAGASNFLWTVDDFSDCAF